MVKVVLTEQMVNAIGAALDDRNKKLVSALVRLKGHPESQSRDFAIETVQEGIRDAMTARLAIAAACEEPDYPEEMTFAALAAGDHFLYADEPDVEGLPEFNGAFR